MPTIAGPALPDEPQYELVQQTDNSFTFNNSHISVDPKAIRSQHVFTIEADHIHYELNVATHAAPEFQNHLKADLNRQA